MGQIRRPDGTGIYQKHRRTKNPSKSQRPSNEYNLPKTLGKNKGMAVQAYLLEYLLIDEEKHDAILSKLESIKKSMYPYG